MLSILFAVYAFGRRREVRQLRQIVKTFQDRAGVAPTEEQLDQLGQLILRSQRNFKELIDSLDDVALAVSLDGTVRTVNRRVTESCGSSLLSADRPQTGRISRRAPSDGRAYSISARFMEKRYWTGVVGDPAQRQPHAVSITTASSTPS